MNERAGHHGPGMTAGGLDHLLAMQREVAVPDDLARRIVVRTAVLPQHGVLQPFATVAAHVPVQRPRAWGPQWAGLAASVALMVALPQLFSRIPDQEPLAPLPQVAVADAPVIPVPVQPPVEGRTAVVETPEREVADDVAVAVPAVMQEAPVEQRAVQLAFAHTAAPTPAAQPEPWPQGRPLNFALAADVGGPAEIYGPVLDPAASHGSATVRPGAGRMVGLGMAEGGGVAGPR